MMDDDHTFRNALVCTLCSSRAVFWDIGQKVQGMKLAGTVSTRVVSTVGDGVATPAAKQARMIF